MPAIPKEKSVITPEPSDGSAYRLERLIHKGQMANSFEARDTASNKVFLKAYTSPSPELPWYRGYIAHLRELARRLAETEAGAYCVKPLALFEARVGGCPYPTLFQVFEFIEGGHDLDHLLRRARAEPDTLRWSQRVIMAKVFLAGMKRVHAAGIIHGDLKPPNVQMLPTTAGVGFRPLLIDLDYSFLADRRAPWHGRQGYIGTPNYHSPEHLLGEGVIPVAASDVFTSALILYDLLGQGNPYVSETTGEFLQKARRGTPPGIILQGPLNRRAADALVSQTLRSALAPDASARPTMEELHAVFLPLAGIDPRGTAAPAAPSPSALPPAPAAGISPAPRPLFATQPLPPAPSPPLPPPFPPLPRLRPAAPAPVVPPAPARLVLTLAGDTGAVEFRATTRVGRAQLARASSQSVFAEETQFAALWDDARGEWTIAPVEGTRNWTVLNGLALERPATVRDGDELCLASRASFSTAMRVKIALRPVSR